MRRKRCVVLTRILNAGVSIGGKILNEMYNVQFTTTAWKQYVELSEEKTIRAVNKAITQITRGVVQGRRKVRNRENTYRIHAGNYRVLYKITASQCIITGIVKKDKKSYK